MSAADVSWVENLFAAQFLVAVLVFGGATAWSGLRHSRAVSMTGFARSRMFGLLRLLRLDPWAYARQTSTFLVETQVRSCEGCCRRGDCEAVLRAAVPVGDLGFCANGSALARFRLEQAGA